MELSEAACLLPSASLSLSLSLYYRLPSASPTPFAVTPSPSASFSVPFPIVSVPPSPFFFCPFPTNHNLSTSRPIYPHTQTHTHCHFSGSSFPTFSPCGCCWSILSCHFTSRLWEQHHFYVRTHMKSTCMTTAHKNSPPPVDAAARTIHQPIHRIHLWLFLNVHISCQTLWYRGRRTVCIWDTEEKSENFSKFSIHEMHCYNNVSVMSHISNVCVGLFN